VHGVADHIGGALLAFRSFRHLQALLQLIKYPIGCIAKALFFGKKYSVSGATAHPSGASLLIGHPLNSFVNG
jgi:hypothetical protein